MPSLTIRTNVSKELIPSDFISETSKVLTATIGKPEKVFFNDFIVGDNGFSL